MENDKCHNIGCSHSEYCKKSELCIAVTPDMRKMVANRVARFMEIKPYQQFSVSSMLESSGKALMDTIHLEQSKKGFATCYAPPY